MDMAGCGGRISRAPNYFTVLPSSSPSGGGGVAEEDLPAMPVWKTYREYSPNLSYTWGETVIRT